MKSYSQIGQDIFVTKYYNNKRNGYYIDIGAYDGIKLSNTYLLEKNFQWKGICIEPLPDIFNLLKKNRPNSICINKAIYSKSGEKLNFDICKKYKMLSGITNFIDTHKKKVNESKKTIQIDTITLMDLLDLLNAPKYIEYLSLDTEGSEYEILKVFDFNKYKFGLIDVEHNFQEPKRTQIRKLLESNNYKYLKENKFDDIYQLI